jgi:DUF4097 and DUF4098 domain-containing protein YvlB
MKNNKTNRLALIAVTLVSCWSSANLVLAAREFTEEFHQTFPLAENGRFSLDNVNGSIHITAWDRAEVKVDAIKKAKTAEYLSKMLIDFKTDDGWVEIKTKLPASSEGRGESGSVEYHVTVPQKIRLDKINSVNGAVEIEGVEGELKVSTVNGALTATQVAGHGTFNTVNGKLEVSLQKLDAEHGVALETVNGKLDLTLPAHASAQVMVKTVNGSIHNDFDLPVKKHFPVGSSLDGQLGNGGPTVKLNTVNGAVNISKGK